MVGDALGGHSLVLNYGDRTIIARSGRCGSTEASPLAVPFLARFRVCLVGASRSRFSWRSYHRSNACGPALFIIYLPSSLFLVIHCITGSLPLLLLGRAVLVSVNCHLPRRRKTILVKVLGSSLCGRVPWCCRSGCFLFLEHRVCTDRWSRNDANAAPW